MFKAIAAALSIALLTLSSQVQASTPPMALFTFTADAGHISYSWESLLNPDVLSSSVDNFEVSAPLAPGEYVTFYSAAIGVGGGFANQADSFSPWDNRQLYTGLESKPTFIFDTFTGIDVRGPDVNHPVFYDDAKLTISSVTAPVPEPETYVMLLAGLGLLGAAVKRRNESKV